MLLRCFRDIAAITSLRPPYARLMLLPPVADTLALRCSMLHTPLILRRQRLLLFSPLFRHYFFAPDISHAILLLDTLIAAMPCCHSCWRAQLIRCARYDAMLRYAERRYAIRH